MLRPHSTLPAVAAFILACPTLQAHTEAQIDRAQQFAARETLASYEQMSALLHKVRDKKSADAAAAPLRRQHQLRQAISLMAENLPKSKHTLPEQHLDKLEQAMNELRMSAARVLRENCYGSERLGKVIRSIAAASTLPSL